MDRALQDNDEDLLVLSGTVLQDVENLVCDDPLNDLFEADPSFFHQFLVLFFIPEDHVRIILQSMYIVNFRGGRNAPHEADLPAWFDPCAR